MKAWRFYAFNDLRLDDIAEPVPLASDAIHAAGKLTFKTQFVFPWRKHDSPGDLRLRV